MTMRSAGKYTTDVLSKSFALSTVVSLKRGIPDIRYPNPSADAPKSKFHLICQLQQKIQILELVKMHAIIFVDLFD